MPDPATQQLAEAALVKAKAFDLVCGVDDQRRALQQQLKQTTQVLQKACETVGCDAESLIPTLTTLMTKSTDTPA